VKDLFPDNSKQTLLILVIILGIVSGGYFLFTQIQNTLRQGQVEDLLLRAETAVTEGNYLQAFELFQQAQDLDPSNPDYQIRQADVAFLNGDYLIATNLYQQSNLGNLAEITYYQALQRLSEMELNSALELLSSSRTDLVDHASQRTNRPLNLNRVEALESNIERIQNETNQPLKQASVAKILIEENALHLAEKTLTSLLADEPTYRDAHYLLGATYLQLGKTNLAQKSLEASLEIDPNYEPARTLLGNIID